MKFKMRRWSKVTLGCALTTLALAAEVALAAEAWVNSARVSRTIVDNEKYGGCMAYLSAKNNQLACSNWVTFDCEGLLEGNTKAIAKLKFDAAQLAFVTQNRVKVLIDDNRKINGQCFASRIVTFGG